MPIASDTNADKPEFCEVVLESPEGGAGLGAFGADVEIAGASYPAGDFTVLAGTPSVTEGSAASFWVSRNFYSQGAVSVTVRVARLTTIYLAPAVEVIESEVAADASEAAPTA